VSRKVYITQNLSSLLVRTYVQLPHNRRPTSRSPQVIVVRVVDYSVRCLFDNCAVYFPAASRGPPVEV
jgi:hypothetical protein